MSDHPRIAKILHHFVDQRIMYLVMDRINLQVSPPDLAARIQEATKWPSELPLPSNHTLGPVGHSRIRHKLKEFEAPSIFPDVRMLDEYIKKVHPRLVFSRIHHRCHFIWAGRTACSQSEPSRRCLFSVLAVNGSCSPSPTWTTPTSVSTKTGGRSWWISVT